VAQRIVVRPEVRQQVAEAIAENGLYARLRTAKGMGAMLLATLRAAVKRPFIWKRDMVLEASLAMRRTANPLLLANAAFIFAAGVIVTGTILKLLGTPDRFGGGMIVATIREVCVWVTTMVVAGVAGSAICADLGARKIREEIDAVEVLGVEPVRSLVVPRVLGLAIAAPLLGVIAETATLAVAILGGTFIQGTPIAAFVTTMHAFLTPADILAFLLKLTIVGAFVGLVASYKGLNAKGGAEGVGRAVNETVVITYVGIWIFNVLFNSVFLATFPDVQVLH
jgi:phospholipid/cholesterol/gamma-HCH transport system permease protein